MPPLISTTDYVDGFVYVNSTLSYFAAPEGRVRNTGSALKNEYVITDQQGNARISIEESTTLAGTPVIRQENSYYAFGLVMANSPVSTPTTDNKQLYNGGSEWQNDFGNLPDYYETFYRNYDAALGRFVGVDPMAEATESLSSYHYAGNNPVMFNDPLGDYQYSPTKNSNYSGTVWANPGIPTVDSNGKLNWGNGMPETVGSSQGDAYSSPYAEGGGGVDITDPDEVQAVIDANLPGTHHVYEKERNGKISGLNFTNIGGNIEYDYNTVRGVDGEAVLTNHHGSFDGGADQGGLGMSLSAAGLKLLQYHELWTGGDVYTDPNGHRTIGYGHFIQPGEKFSHITKAQGVALLAKDAQKSVNYVNRLVTGVTLTQTEFDALVDFEFNIGDHHFANSSLLRDLNAGNFDLIKADFMQWTDHGAGYAVRRREDDIQLFDNGIYVYR